MVTWNSSTTSCSTTISKNCNISIPLSIGSGPYLHTMIWILSQILQPFTKFWTITPSGATASWNHQLSVCWKNRKKEGTRPLIALKNIKVSHLNAAIFLPFPTSPPSHFQNVISLESLTYISIYADKHQSNKKQLCSLNSHAGLGH